MGKLPRREFQTENHLFTDLEARKDWHMEQAPFLDKRQLHCLRQFDESMTQVGTTTN
jgi:hypothetical protein